jgi:DNA-binding NarL/FixJ family response regulator
MSGFSRSEAVLWRSGARLTRKSLHPANTFFEPLSERELEILRFIATGASNKEIAGKLFLAEGTVKNHVTNILGKLQVRDRTQAAIKAKDSGLI